MNVNIHNGMVMKMRSHIFEYFAKPQKYVAIAALLFVCITLIAPHQGYAEITAPPMSLGVPTVPTLPPIPGSPITAPPMTLSGTTDPNSVCSDGANFDIPLPTTNNPGIITSIVDVIQNKLSTFSKDLFKKISSDAGFGAAVRGALTLFIVVYGVLFMTGMIDLKLHDFITRMIKFGIVFALLQPTSWEFFSGDTDNPKSLGVVKFFNEGTNHIICKVTEVTVGGVANAQHAMCTNDGKGAFIALDNAIGKVASGKMAVSVLATFTTGPYGVLFGVLLIFSLISFLKSLLSAMGIFIMSLAMKTLLFGLAPIFIPCILFQRTRHLFDGWLNQVVNASLQPLLLFIFFAFFITLISASIDVILNTPVCWTEFPKGYRGSPFAFYYWRFAVPMLDSAGVPLLNSAGKIMYQPYAGEWTWNKAFPIDLLTILTFLILAELANRFNAVVGQIASELAGASSGAVSGIESAFSGGMSGKHVGGGFTGAMGKSNQEAARGNTPVGGRTGPNK